jgi:acetyltransferase-like isoleucine patch superfamily enzyme
MLSRETLEKMGFAELGEDLKVFELAVFAECQNIYLGDGCKIDDFVFIMGSKPIRIGRRVHITNFCSLVGGGEIIIEDYCGLSAGVRLISGTDDFLGGGMTGPTIPPEYRKIDRGYIHLEKFVVLGTNTIVHPNVTVGEGAVTGSGTIVTKDLDPWGIYIGQPARRVKERPRDKIIALEQSLIERYGY